MQFLICIFTAYLSFDAITGYVFPTPKSIEPFLEQTRAGPSSSFCSSLAKRLECYVVAGYPERLADGERIEEKPDILGANGATLFGPDGEPVGHYRKSHLYELDVPWAKAGDVDCSLSFLSS
jgi:protein N-terminal amidase